MTLPIIAVTGKVVPGERQRCIEAGANDYVPKPVDSADLLAALKLWLPKTGSSGPAVTVAGSSPVVADLASLADLPVSVIAGLKVLMVDDDYRNIFALSALLERGKAEVSVAESGADAISLLERNPDIQLVLMDIMMPVMDGYQTIQAIRAIEQFKELPIIAVTGKVVPGERQRCIAAGANDYVTKPVDTAELLAAVRPWIPSSAQPA